ncbi:MAG: hypothetical protein IAF58_22205 [Leptolyngbya sp.]|nr:hypothetical protein [Candidatus Melainabacteria bacterium]
MQETLGGIYACWLSKADELLFHLQMSDADRLKISIDTIHLIRRSMEGNHNNMFSLAFQCGQVYFQIPGRTAEHLAAAEYWLQCAIDWAVPDFDLEYEIEIAKEFLRKIEVLRKNSDQSQDGSTK